MKTVETSPLEDCPARKQLVRRWLSSGLLWLGLVAFLIGLADSISVRAGGPHPRFPSFGMVLAPLIIGLACLVRPAFRFRPAVGILWIGMSFGLALEWVRFPGEFEHSGCCPPSHWCITNLKQIEGAKANWALEEHKSTNDTPRAEDLYGDDRYIRVEPKCPLQGVYSIGRMTVPPRCSFVGHSVE